AREIELMVERGLSNMQAIQTATGWAAECVGQEKNFGTVTVGKYADFLVVDGDPLKDIGVFRAKDSIKMVMKGGVAYVDHLPVAEPQPVGD
ncbi:MAG: amidohydrolase family protein, partial [Chloroflexi bacterium]|nr:amidohydrolase family protein [Chloroflexota bacterium]